MSTCDTKREPLKQQGILGVYIASVNLDGGQEKLFKPVKWSKASGTSSNSFRNAPDCKIRPLKRSKSARSLEFDISPGEGANSKLHNDANVLTS